MTDQTNRLPAALEVGRDALYQQIVLLSARACSWAESLFDGTLDVLLWPRERGDFPHGIPYRVTQQKTWLGVCRLTLVPEHDLPAGATVLARNELVKALTASSASAMPLVAVDQVVQCGLFGEVLYR